MFRAIALTTLVLILLVAITPTLTADPVQNCIGDHISNVAQNTEYGASDDNRRFVEQEPGFWGERVSRFHAEHCMENNGK